MSAPLPPAARRMVAATFVSSLGTGFTLPFTLILLHEVRDIALPTVGLLLAVPGVIGLMSVPVAGALIDRFGPRAVLRSVSVVAASSQVVLATCSSIPAILAGMVLLGFGLGPTFPAAAALMNGLVSGTEATQRAFGIQFTALNAAIGIGGLVGAGLVDVDRAWTFEVLYWGNALTYCLQVLLVPRAPRPEPSVEQDQPSYREVLGDPVFRRVMVVSLLLALTGYSALDSGMPAFARVVGGVEPSQIALVFAVNTALIVSGQLAILRLVRGRHRSAMLAVAAATWGLSWALLGLVPGLSEGGRLVVVLVFGALFGLGECFMAPTLQPLVNALATDRLRGRYNAASGACFSIAFVVSPAISGFLIGQDHGVAWLVGIVVLSGIAAVVALRLRRDLSPEQEGLATPGLPVPG